MVAPDSGRFDIGDTVRFGYFSQEGLQFDEQQKVIDVVKDIAEFIDMGGGKHFSASQFLQYFLFTPEQQHNYVYKLSGGERRKLYLCTVLMKNPNFLQLLGARRAYERPGYRDTADSGRVSSGLPRLCDCGESRPLFHG